MDRSGVLIDDDRVVLVGLGIEVAVGLDGAAPVEVSALLIGDPEVDPALVGVVGASGEGMAYPLVPHHDVELGALAGNEARARLIDGQEEPLAAGGRGGADCPLSRSDALGPQGEYVDGELLVTEEGLGSPHRLLVPPDV